MKDKDGERQGSLSAAAIGLALHLAWTFATTFGTFSIAPGSELPDAFAGAGLPMPLVFLAAAVVEAITLAAAGVFMQGDPRLLYNKKVVTASAFIMAAATIAVFVAHPSGEFGVVLSVIAGIAVGVGSAALILFWGIAFSRLSLASIALNTGIAVALSVIAYVFLVHVLPSSAQWVVAILPVLEVPFARLASPDRYAERRSLPLFRSFPVRRGPFALLLCAAMLLFGFSLGLLKAMSASSIQSTQDMVVQVVALLLACIAVPLLLSLVLYGGEEDARWDLLLRPLVVVSYCRPSSRRSFLRRRRSWRCSCSSCATSTWRRRCGCFSWGCPRNSACRLCSSWASAALRSRWARLRARGSCPTRSCSPACRRATSAAWSWRRSWWDMWSIRAWRS